MTKRILEVPARAVVAVVGALRRHKTATSSIGLLLILAIGVWHLMIGALDIDPLATHYRVRVELARSGGLLPGQDVTLHGVKVGTVESVEVNDHRVIAVAAIDTETRIPASGHARAASLSAAGEQYLDFTADTDSGPFLADGAIIGSDRTSTPVPLSDMLESLSGTLVQIDPTTLRAIVDELGVSETGPEKLAAIIDGGTFLIASLDGVLPQTVRLLRNSKVVLTTLADSEAGMRETAADLAATMGVSHRWPMVSPTWSTIPRTCSPPWTPLSRRTRRRWCSYWAISPPWHRWRICEFPRSRSSSSRNSVRARHWTP